MLSVAPTVVTVWRYHKQADVLHCVCTVLWCGVVLRDPPVLERHIMWQLYDSCALLFNDVCCAVPCCAAVLQDPPVSERHIMWCLYDSCAVLYVDMWYAVLCCPFGARRTLLCQSATLHGTCMTVMSVQQHTLQDQLHAGGD